MVTPFVGTLLDRVNELIKEFPQLIQTIEANNPHLEPSVFDLLYNPDMPFYSAEAYKADLIAELKAYKKHLEDLNKMLNDDLLNFGQQHFYNLNILQISGEMNYMFL